MISFLYDLSDSDRFCKFKQMVPTKYINVLGNILMCWEGFPLPIVCVKVLKKKMDHTIKVIKIS